MKDLKIYTDYSPHRRSELDTQEIYVNFETTTIISQKYWSNKLRLQLKKYIIKITLSKSYLRRTIPN